MMKHADDTLSEIVSNFNSTINNYYFVDDKVFRPGERLIPGLFLFPPCTHKKCDKTKFYFFKLLILYKSKRELIEHKRA